MSQSEYRKKLFWNGKPNIRFFEFNTNDYGWLWAAFKDKSEQEVTQTEFIAQMSKIISQYQFVYLVEDRNDKFKDGFGAFALVCAKYDGHQFEPHVEYFPWATPRNKLRGCVAFYQKMKYNKDVAVTLVRCGEHDRTFFSDLHKYLSIKSCGMIPKGRTDGNEFLYFIFGKKR